jgi:thiamine biosynthesis protein ThiI
MLKTAERIAKRRGALGIIMGDSLGQVASQTLANLYIESSSVDIPIYRPLIGLDKEEIIQISKKIGTFDVFMKNPNTKCTFLPDRVVTKGNPREFERIMSIFEEKGIFERR